MQGEWDYGKIEEGVKHFKKVYTDDDDTRVIQQTFN